ncbi:MAG: hypothetical protein H6721_28645 [Sandaracinus sp.]|nr:hypothetical protein [Sandaracinus sp.]
MNARTQFRRALGTTFAVHVLSTAVAAWAALELGGALVGAASPHPFVAEGFAHGGPIAPETLATFGKHAFGPLFLALGAMLAAYGLASIPLSLIWLGAMQGETAWRRLPRQLLRAVGAAIVLWVPLAIVAGGLAVALPLSWHFAFEGDVDPRLHDLGCLAALLPALAVAARWSSWADHVRASIAIDLPVFAALKAGWRAGATAEYLLFLLAAAILFGGSVAVAGLPLGWLFAQFLALGRTYLRAGWWARAQARAMRLADDLPSSA